MRSARGFGATVALLIACACGKEDGAEGGGHAHGGNAGSATAGEGGVPDDGGKSGDGGDAGQAGANGGTAPGGGAGTGTGGSGGSAGMTLGGTGGGAGMAGESGLGGEAGGGGESGGEGGAGAEGGTGAGSGGAPGGSGGSAGGGMAGLAGSGAGSSGSGGTGGTGGTGGAGGASGGGTGGSAGASGSAGMAGSGGFSDVPVTGDPLRPRHGHSATLDDASSRVYIFGGQGYHDLYDDLMVFDVRTNVLTRLSTQGSAPSPRLNHVAVFDSVGRRLIVFGGRGYYDLYDDVYALGVDTLPLTWTRLSPSGAPPSPREGHVAVFDAARNRMVVFGGETRYDLAQDTVELAFTSGVNGTWRALAPAGTPPSPRTEAAVTFDASTRRAFVGGGLGFHDVYVDLAVLDLTGADGSWSSASPAPVTGVSGAWIWDSIANRLFQESGQAYYGLLGGQGTRPVTDAALVYVGNEAAALLIAGQGFHELSGRISRLDF